jgi:hypothetical protein
MAPAGDLSRLAGQDRVFLQDLLRSWAVDDVPVLIN